MERFAGPAGLNVALYLFAALVTFFILIVSVSAEGRKRTYMQFFILLCVLNVVMLLGECMLTVFAGSVRTLALAKIGCLLSFGCSYAIFAAYAYCLVAFIRERESVSYRIAHVISAVCAVIIACVFLSLFFGLLFYFDADGHFHYTRWDTLLLGIDFLLIFIEASIVFRYREVLTLKWGLLLTFAFFPVASIPMAFVWDTAPLYLAVTLALVPLHGLFQSEAMRRLAERDRQLAEDARQLAEKDRLLTENRIATMISQIKPHFIYNTLGTIEQFCLEDPPKAADLVRKFSQYLRGNFTELNNPAPIRLSQELRHVKLYTDIEQIRFPDMRVSYDLRSGEFLLPALTIQPLVENAIKHGLMKLESGGSVVISTYEMDEIYCVQVRDDGVGFDPTKELDARQHIGIENIRTRLAAVCGGTLSIASAPGAGTTALITIPKEGSHDRLDG